MHWVIAGWRAAFGIGDFAFVYVQLAPYLNAGNVTEVRLQQASALPSPGIGMGTDITGMVVTIDKGDITGGVHSHHKAPVAERAALVFQHVAYSKQVANSSDKQQNWAFRGPQIVNATIVGDFNPFSDSEQQVELVLQFDQVGTGLRLGDTTSCGLIHNPNRSNHTPIHNPQCVSEGETPPVEVMAASINCCCESVGNGSFFVCDGASDSVRVGEAGCVPASAMLMHENSSSANTLSLRAVLSPSVLASSNAASKLRLAIMAVDQPGCAVYSSFALPSPPAFVDVPLKSTPVTQAIREVPTKSSSKEAQKTFSQTPPMGYNTCPLQRFRFIHCPNALRALSSAYLGGSCVKCLRV
jgi:hypothetical protein